MTLFPMLKRTLVVYGMQQQNIYSKLSPADTCSYEPIEGKTLNDQLFAAIHFSKNKEFNGGGLFASE